MAAIWTMASLAAAPGHLGGISSTHPGSLLWEKSRAAEDGDGCSRACYCTEHLKGVFLRVRVTRGDSESVL
jgi:hypothetical protein